MNSIDGICFSIIGFSMLIGLLQGFTKEILRVVTWSGASIAAYYGHSLTEPFLVPFVTKGIFLDWVSKGVTFLVMLIVLNLLSQNLIYKIRGSVLKGIDGTLGMLLGGVRGGFIVTVAYVLYLSFNPSKPDHQSEYLKNSRLTPLIDKGLLELAALNPENVTLQGLKNTIMNAHKKPDSAHHKNSENVSIQSLIDMKRKSLPPPPPMVRRPLLTYIKDLLHISPTSQPNKPAVSSPNTAYDTQQRKGLNQFISDQSKLQKKSTDAPQTEQ